MHEPLHEFKVGFATVRVFADHDASDLNPLDSYEDSIVFATLERRSGLRPSWAQDPADIVSHAEVNNLWDIPLFKYEHGLCSYRVSMGENPFTGRAQHAEWDSGRVGSMLMSKKEWATEADALQAAEVICGELTNWINGSVFGYVVSVPDNDHVSSCWGFIADAPDEKYIVDEATSAAEAAIKDYVPAQLGDPVA